jgi:hypothetical protein
MFGRLRSALLSRVTKSTNLQAEIDFFHCCPLLELHEHIAAGERDPVRLEHLLGEFEKKWRKADLGKKIWFANDSMTIQLSEMFQHLHDIDSGDIPLPAAAPALEPERRTESAAFQPSAGPSTHTNPRASLELQLQHLHDDDKTSRDIAYREQLRRRHGFALWVGPSQAATPEHKAGIYVKGRVPPGTVIGLYPGAVYNGEMLQKAMDAGHLANPAVRRALVPRFDESVIDVHAAEAPRFNPYALAHHARHPPRGVAPNVLRIQYDFLGESDQATSIMPFPPHLRDYIPNTWGSEVTTGQQIYGALEWNIWAKGSVLVALRTLWDEEAFVDHALSPRGHRPDWYHAVDAAAEERTWKRLAA